MFNQHKVLQEVIYLLRLNGGRLNLLKLIKELYMADRESIKERESSISGDVYFSMKHGPVLSQTLNLLNDSEEWSDYFEHIATKDYDDLILTDKASRTELDRLSEKDKEYLEKVAEKYRQTDKWKLVDITHKLPEWKKIDKGRDKIKFGSILKAVGFSDDEILDIRREHAFMECLV
jgi:uncharacterized phage-associated protein